MNNPLDHKGTSTTPQAGCAGRWIKATVAASVMVSSLFLSGCSTMMCVGTGTCADGTMTFKGTQAKGQFTPQTVITSQGTYIVIRDHQSGTISSIIQTSRGK